MNTEYWELIAKKLAGELSSEEEKEFEQWLKSDSLNQQRLKEAEYIWKTSGSLNKNFEPDTEQAWLRLKEQVDDGKIKTLPVSKTLWLKIAAGIAAVVVLGFLIKYLMTERVADMPLPVMAEIITTDSVKVFYLSDSTRISLNKNSRFTYPEKFTDSVRMVSLAGEAFFEVTPHAIRPFIIEAGKMETRVLGTSFNIRAYEKDEEVKVSVVTGKVQVAIKDTVHRQPLILKEGEQVTYNKTNASVKKQKANNRDMWWKKFDPEKDLKKLLNKGQRELRKLKKG